MKFLFFSNILSLPHMVDDASGFSTDYAKDPKIMHGSYRIRL